MKRLTAWLERHAGALMAFCMLMFLLDCFMIGFVSLVAPAMAPVMAYSAVMFMIGALVNALVVRFTQKKR